ncbi:GATA zinc finger protein [Colletotrichum cereale]|nr:GATA zinc finger protein [Colletotrichum cereale]
MGISDSEAVEQAPGATDTVSAGASDTDPASPHTPSGDSRVNASILLSLNQLKAGELIQRIHADTSQLLNNIQSLLHSDFLLGGRRRSRIPGVIVSHPSLLVAQTLSQQVAVNVDELVTLCHNSAASAEQQLPDITPPRERRKRRRKHRTDSAGSYCYPQKTTSTPQWRNGPAGLWTLCNVCGLMYARQVRRNGLVKRKSSSPEASQDSECQTVADTT